MWKIKNITDMPVKLAAAQSNTVTRGIILKPEEFCICDSRMTASIDAQERRKFIEVDRSFNNDLKLNLCECYNDAELKKAVKEAAEYLRD